ncbi:Piso0_004602 [Millerozyma farinosa CBS 7064]|uniref:Piso0_004602 protein n=1 Tax=Pichia sorbitophila (strain ATCC MYA-4447 / BCRC 22081 / CBS 7064 / NBRC 10061 / NRRL Y-12695) TaxID=559304 RepID=G8Y5X2_PICSO|nr:Piso0_004602 [Millerozyma farinosa CBS 7064]CCE85033.1 Piso0_004602 [Millerozyma farinosa CBS 7064]
MNRVKLKIVVIPSQFADIPTDSLASFNSRKFLHLTDPETSLEKVCGELTRRFKRLYPFEEEILIENLQDDDKCDLDAEFKVSDVLGPGETLRVVIGNDLNPNRANANRSYMSTILNSNSTPSQAKLSNLHHPSQSTPLISAAPALIQENTSPISNRTITQRFFETSDQNIPMKSPNHTNHSKTYDENSPRDSSAPLTMKRIRPSKKADSSKSKISLDNDDSHISFPPPEQEEDRTIPQKRELSKPSEYPLPGKRRITSGMLAMPPHAQLEKERIEQEINSSQHNATSMKNISSGSSSEDEDSSVVLPPASENLDVEESQAEIEHDNDNDPKEDAQSSIEEAKKETLTKSEIIKLFKNGMKIPPSIRNRFASKNGSVDMDEIQKNAIIRNLEIDMVDGNIIPAGEKRATRGHSKKTKGNAETPSSPPKKGSEAEQDVTSKNSEDTQAEDHRESNLPDTSVPANPESVTINKDNESSQVSDSQPKAKTSFATNINDKSTSENLDEILGEFEELDSRLKSYKKQSYDSQIGNSISEAKRFESKNETTSNISNGGVSQTKSAKTTGGTIVQDTEADPVKEQEKPSKDKNRTQESGPSSQSPPKTKVSKIQKDVKDKKDAETAQKASSAPQVSKKETNTRNSTSTPSVISRKNSKNSDSSDNSSSSEDDNSEDEQKENKRPRLADDVHSVSQKGTGISFKRKIDKPKSRIENGSKETPKGRPMEAEKSTAIDKAPGKQPTEEKKDGSVASGRKKSYSNEIKKPVLTSLKDLALRGVPDVESNRKKSDPASKAASQKAVTGSNIAVESSSESDSEDESSSDDSSDSSNGSSSSSDDESDKETSDKFIDAKKFKKKKKTRGGFTALMKDAKKL